MSVAFMTRPVRLIYRLHQILLIVPLIVGLAVGGIVRDAHADNTAQNAGSTRSYDIPSGPLGATLSKVAADANIALSFDPALTEGLTNPPLVGTYTVREAITRLLADSGLKIVGREDGSYTLSKTGEAVLPEVKVRDRVDNYVATEGSTGTKTNTPLIETPQSISVVTRSQIEAQQIDSAKQALRYSAGVIPETRANFGSYDIVYNRGFGVDRYLDGMRLQGNSGYVTPQTDLYDVESIELLRGPSSVLFGQGSPGGVLNMVSKKPTAEPLHEIELQGGSYDRKQAAFDSSGAIDSDQHFRYRLTGLVRDADSQVDYVKERRFSIAPALTWQPSKNTSLTILTNYQHDPNAGLYNLVPSVGSVSPNPNGKIPTSFYTGDPNFNKVDRTQYSAGYLFEHHFDETWTVRQNLRYQNTAGDMNQVLPFGLEPDDVTLDRYSQATRERIVAFTIDNQVEAKFATGAVQHTALVGFDYQHTSFNQKLVQDFTSSIDIFNPIYHQDIAQPALLPSSTHQAQSQAGVYAQDQIKYDQWVVVGGIRHDRANSDTTDILGGTSSSQNDSANTGRVGVVYLFDSGIAPYVTYATSFQPTAGTDFSGRAFDPTTAKLYEAGVKYQPSEWNGFFTLSGYQLTEQNVTTADSDPTHTGFLVQTGEIRSRGAELEGKVSLTDRLNVTGSYTYIDAVVTKSNDVDLGKEPLWIPHDIASLWGDYTVWNGLDIGLGARYIGASYGDAANTERIPAYTLIDAALHYDLGALDQKLKGLWLAVNISNLFDRTYVSECTNDNCLYGLRRSILGTIRYRW